jgi:hypothetical protein
MAEAQPGKLSGAFASKIFFRVIHKLFIEGRRSACARLVRVDSQASKHDGVRRGVRGESAISSV